MSEIVEARRSKIIMNKTMGYSMMDQKIHKSSERMEVEIYFGNTLLYLPNSIEPTETVIIVIELLMSYMWYNFN